MPQDNAGRIEAILSLSGADLDEVKEQVLDALQDEDPEVRRAAVSVLVGSFDEAHAPLLISVLDDQDIEVVKIAAYFLLDVEDFDVRFTAIKELSRRKDRRLVPIFLIALRDEWPCISRKAAEALAALQDVQVVEPLLELLREPAPRGSALQCAELVLSSLQAPQLVASLKSLLGDNEIGFRAALILGARSDHESRNALLAALGDGDRQAQIHAMRGVSLNGDRRALKRLFSLLINEDPAVQAGAVHAVERILHSTRSSYSGGWKPGQEEVRALLHAVNDEDPHVRASALGALGHLRASESVPVLLKALEDPSSYVVIVAVRALAHMRSPEAVKPLLALLDRHEGIEKELIIGALGDLGDAVACGKLRQLLDDEDWEVQVEAAQALFRLGAKDVWDRLVQALGEAEKDRYFTRAEVAGTIAGSNDPRGVDVLLETLRMLTLEHGSDNGLLVRVISLLGDLGDARAVEAIEKWRNYHYDERDDWDHMTLIDLEETVEKALRRLKKASR